LRELLNRGLAFLPGISLKKKQPERQLAITITKLCLPTFFLPRVNYKKAEPEELSPYKPKAKTDWIKKQK